MSFEDKNVKRDKLKIKGLDVQDPALETGQEASLETTQETAQEQSAEEIQELNDTARIETKKAVRSYEDIKSRIDNLLTTIDLNTSRKGKVYKGFEKLEDALDDAGKIIESAPADNVGRTDAMNNILSGTRSRMEILARDTSFALDELNRADEARESIQDESMREGVKQESMRKDLEEWQSSAKEMLNKIDRIEAGAGRDAARMLAEETEEEHEARKAENKALEDIGW